MQKKRVKQISTSGPQSHNGYDICRKISENSVDMPLDSCRG